MNTNSHTINMLKPRRGVYAPLFALWVAMASIVMMFGSLTSAYLVRQAAGNWLEFVIPDVFFFSTMVILLSSFTLHLSYWAFKNGKQGIYRLALPVSLLLGVVFITLQYMGWMELYDVGVLLDGNPSGSFFYLISGLHAAHVIGGIFAISVATLHAFTLSFKPTEKRRRRFQIVLHYWHFVDFLWLYLFIFLLIQ
ncbi:MAG TPA: cytochrome c oxidase subunit 3 [Saprospiraceae bacterium]|nr:cytochrome c oxidase subunit 3 [Saprospiraceae bacterium]